jgi:hypothetical protein
MKTQQGLTILIFDLKNNEGDYATSILLHQRIHDGAGREDVYKIIKKDFRLISSTYIR